MLALVFMELLNQKKGYSSLARWFHRLERHPMHQNVWGVTPIQGTYPGCGFSPQLGCVQEATTDVLLSHQCLSQKIYSVLYFFFRKQEYYFK